LHALQALVASTRCRRPQAGDRERAIACYQSTLPLIVRPTPGAGRTWAASTPRAGLRARAGKPHRACKRSAASVARVNRAHAATWPGSITLGTPSARPSGRARFSWPQDWRALPRGQRVANPGAVASIAGSGSKRCVGLEAARLKFEGVGNADFGGWLGAQGPAHLAAGERAGLGRACRAASTGQRSAPGRGLESSSSRRSSRWRWRKFCTAQVAGCPGQGHADRQAGLEGPWRVVPADGRSSWPPPTSAAPRPSSPARPLDGRAGPARSPFVATPSSRFPAVASCCRCSNPSCACRAPPTRRGRWRRRMGWSDVRPRCSGSSAGRADRPQQRDRLVRGESGTEKSCWPRR